MDGDGKLEMTVNYKTQHELGQVYIYFKLIDEPEVEEGSAWALDQIGIILAIVLIVGYIGFRILYRRSRSNSNNFEDKISSEAEEIGGIENES